MMRESSGEEFKPVAVEEHRRDGTGRLKRWARIVRGDRFAGAPPRLSWEDYEYRADGALSEAVAHRPTYDQKHAVGGLAVGDIAVTRDEFTYDDAGELVSIRRVRASADNDAWIVSRRRPASLRPALRKVEDVLVEYTVGWARDHWPEEPVYCLGLVCYGPSSLTLDAAFGTQSAEPEHEPQQRAASCAGMRRYHELAVARLAGGTRRVDREQPLPAELDRSVLIALDHEHRGPPAHDVADAPAGRSALAHARVDCGERRAGRHAGR